MELHQLLRNKISLWWNCLNNKKPSQIQFINDDLFPSVIYKLVFVQKCERSKKAIILFCIRTTYDLKLVKEAK